MRNIILVIVGVVVIAGAYIWFSMPKTTEQTIAAPVVKSAPVPVQRSAAVQKVAAVKGAIAPDFELKNMAGENIRLSDYRGKVVVLNFWATWCPPCKKEMPSMERLYQVFSGSDFVMLAVNSEKNGYKNVERFQKNKNYSFPVLLDSDAAVQKTYRVSAFPETFIIDKKGVIVEKVIGGIKWDGQQVLAFFKKKVEE